MSKLLSALLLACLATCLQVSAHTPLSLSIVSHLESVMDSSIAFLDDENQDLDPYQYIHDTMRKCAKIGFQLEQQQRSQGQNDDEDQPVAIDPYVVNVGGIVGNLMHFYMNEDQPKAAEKMAMGVLGNCINIIAQLVANKSLSEQEFGDLLDRIGLSVNLEE
jgi:hypothetical protein